MRKIGLLVVLSAIVGTLWAVPARKGGLVVTQPDGSELTVYQHGDEHFHWMTNEKGEWLRLDEDGFYQVTEALNPEDIKAKRMASPRRVEYRETPLNIAPMSKMDIISVLNVVFPIKFITFVYYFATLFCAKIRFYNEINKKIGVYVYR